MVAKRWLRILIRLVVLLLVVPWFCVQVLPNPWTFIFGTWAAFLFWLTFEKPPVRGRLVWFNVGVVFVVLGAAELILPPGPYRFNVVGGGDSSEGRERSDEEYGFEPVPGTTRRSIVTIDDELVFDVTATIDERGLRVSPPVSDPPPTTSLVFFGCSLTFGSGVEDDETYPYRVGVLTGGRYVVYNFAYSRYGPHQMLAGLESGRVQAIADTPPEHVFFLAIPQHYRRVVADVPFGKHAPRYVLEDDGTVRRDGNLDEFGVVEKRLRKWLRKSHVYLRIWRPLMRSKWMELNAAIIAAARERVAKEWPDAKFHVLLWDMDSIDETLAALRAFDIEPYLVSDMLPRFHEDRSRWENHPGDRHPTPAADDGIAHWIVREILDDR